MTVNVTDVWKRLGPGFLEFKRKLDMKLTDEERVNDLDESSYLTGYDLDVDRLVYLEVLMSWPLKVL